MSDRLMVCNHISHYTHTRTDAHPHTSATQASNVSSGDALRAQCKHDLAVVQLKNAEILSRLAREEEDKCRRDLAASGENLNDSHSGAVHRAPPPPYDEGRRVR